MSAVWQLYCSTCDEGSEYLGKWAGEPLEDVIRLCPEIERLLERGFEIRHDYISDIPSQFIFEHSKHELLVRNDYGDFL